MSKNTQAGNTGVLINGYTELETLKNAKAKDLLISEVFGRKVEKAANLQDAVECIKESGKDDIIRLFMQMSLNHVTSKDYGGEDDKHALCLIMDLLQNL